MLANSSNYSKRNPQIGSQKGWGLFQRWTIWEQVLKSPNLGFLNDGECKIKWFNRMTDYRGVSRPIKNALN